MKSIGSYPQEDVTFLVKDLSDIEMERGTKEREAAIQSGTHYSEMLPIEYEPTAEYMALYHESLTRNASKLALCTGVVSTRMYHKFNDQPFVLVSLARAGTPVGILIKRYLETQFQCHVPHYSISIIRDRGIDEVALRYILDRHPGCQLQFVDGWTGKGAITKELTASCQRYYEKYGVSLDDELAVLADPGYCSSLFGTREDFLIPSACLNSTVSGLVSRTVLNRQWIGEGDFHGAKYYKHLEEKDVSVAFIEEVARHFKDVHEEAVRRGAKKEDTTLTWRGLADLQSIQEDFHIENMNFIKPGVGETTRVLLRRVPWKILVKDKQDQRIQHILLLARDRGVTVEQYEKMTYTCCGLIQPLTGGVE
ncbi:hypothetical protein A374_06361 [Fictibacillus macauensis ZFHKF-1]|uniref:Uncharacterized protein n=1 Tax=Fictibacillus macauensis ZFHKF-1 TaxID=1196324 RepID=I8UH21_9BACL|nr:cysteine protease StiP family protein [Fictibacillus macauensis]EIT86200.1 hypothetical protein A374_06361 [Fictibacillus macauensis ZFHKF-1]